MLTLPTPRHDNSQALRGFAFESEAQGSDRLLSVSWSAPLGLTRRDQLAGRL